MSSTNTHPKVVRSVWWVHPTLIFGLVVIGAMLAATLLSDEAYALYGVPKYLTWSYFGWALGAVGAFAVGRRLAAFGDRYTPSDDPQFDGTLHRWFVAATILTLFGYAVWFAMAIKNGLSPGIVRELIFNPESGAAFTIKEDIFTTIPGVTTCTQFAMAAVILGMWTYLRGNTRVRPVLFLLFGVTIVRAFLYSERLALIELTVPAIIVYLRFRVLGCALTPARQRVVHLGPLGAVAGLLVLFGGLEYFRSWPFYEHQFNSLAEFTLWRLSGYYTTALNNGAMLLEYRGDWPLPYASLHAIWTLPFMRSSPFSYERLTGMNPGDAYDNIMQLHGNPELNNDSGLFQPALDFGLLGFGVFWLFYGILAGRLFRGYLAGGRAGVLLYPVLFVSLLETPRILYLPSARVFPTLMLLIAFIAWTHWARSGKPGALAAKAN